MPDQSAGESSQKSRKPPMIRHIHLENQGVAASFFEQSLPRQPPAVTAAGPRESSGALQRRSEGAAAAPNPELAPVIKTVLRNSVSDIRPLL